MSGNWRIGIGLADYVGYSLDSNTGFRSWMKPWGAPLLITYDLWPDNDKTAVVSLDFILSLARNINWSCTFEVYGSWLMASARIILIITCVKFRLEIRSQSWDNWKKIQGGGATFVQTRYFLNFNFIPSLVVWYCYFGYAVFFLVVPLIYTCMLLIVVSE